MNWISGNNKYRILIGIFVLIAVLTFLSRDYTAATPVSTTMSEASLPVVRMQTAGGTLYNETHGYTTNVDARLMNSSITPLEDNRKLSIVINHYGENVSEISYKLRRLSDMSLMEDTQVTDYTTDEEQMYATLHFKNLLDNDVEYLLELVLSTDHYDQIRYYTKIVNSTGLNVQTKLDFVMQFNEWTYDYTQLDNISKYIETKSTGDNTNFGKVNINSTKAQIGWGDLNPVVEQTIIPTLNAITSEVASICLEYNMAAQGTEGYYDSYVVHEYYRVRQSGDDMYLLNFEREANQVFDSRADLMNSSRINLGISSSEEEPVASSADGAYTCFVRQGNLWSFHSEDNTFTRIFSFDDESSDHVRELYNQHNIKIMSVEDNGNVNFIVYGYMNRGEHEGAVGVSLCAYNAADNEVSELIYIPAEVPYEVLSEGVGAVAYIGRNGAFYILLDDTLFSIDLTSKEKMIEISGLTDETYTVSAAGTAIAYSTNGRINDTDEIRIFDMASGSDYMVKAEAGDKLKVLGYIKNDLAYGYAHASDILTEDNGTITFPMYRIVIMNSANEIIKEYENPGIYVSNTSIAGMRMNMTRVVKTADGNYEGTTIDQLLNRDENAVTAGAQLEVVATESRKKELYIDLPVKVTNVASASMKTSSRVIFSSGEVIESNVDYTDAQHYYVYGYGKFQGRFTSLERAIAKANETYGTVFDNDARTIWTRYKQS